MSSLCCPPTSLSCSACGKDVFLSIPFPTGPFLHTAYIWGSEPQWQPAWSRRTSCMSRILLVGPEPEVPEDLGSHSHSGLPPRPPNRAQSFPHDCFRSSHDCPSSSTFSLRSGPGPHHIPVPKGIGPSCTSSLQASCSLSLHQLLPTFRSLSEVLPRCNFPSSSARASPPW